MHCSSYCQPATILVEQRRHTLSNLTSEATGSSVTALKANLSPLSQKLIAAGDTALSEGGK